MKNLSKVQIQSTHLIDSQVFFSFISPKFIINISEGHYVYLFFAFVYLLTVYLHFDSRHPLEQ